MKLLISLSALVACGLAAEEAKVITAPLAYAGYPAAGYGYTGYPYAGYGYAAAPVAAAPVVTAAPVAAVAPYAAYAPYSAGSQFHSQDEFGNLNYGYANLNSVKQEVGNTYGGVSGGYSYVDAEGKLQQVTYAADALGFRTQDSRLPVAPVYDGVAPTFNPEPLVAPKDTPEVAAAKAEHLAAVEAAKAVKVKRDTAEEAKVITAPLAYAGYPAAGYGYTGYPYAGYGYAAAPVAAAPVATAAPLAAVAPYAAYAPYSAGSQFHSQDEFGNLNYGYANLNSVKQEVGNTFGGVSGGYSYVDAEGKLQQVTYAADALGFRTQDSRLPVAPVYDGVAPTFNPEPLVAPKDTPEVAAAKADHLAAVEAAKAA